MPHSIGTPSSQTIAPVLVQQATLHEPSSGWNIYSEAESGAVRREMTVRTRQIITENFDRELRTLARST